MLELAHIGEQSIVVVSALILESSLRKMQLHSALIKVAGGSMTVDSNT